MAHETDASRRDWLGLLTRAAAGVSAATITVPLARFLIPVPHARSAEVPPSTIVCSDADLGPGDSRSILVDGRPVVVFRSGDAPPRAFDATCTHLGCTVRYDKDEDAIVCACHGAVFDPSTGEPTRGPATRPLASLPVKVRNDRVIVGA